MIFRLQLWHRTGSCGNMMLALTAVTNCWRSKWAWRQRKYVESTFLASQYLGARITYYWWHFKRSREGESDFVTKIDNFLVREREDLRVRQQSCSQIASNLQCSKTATLSTFLSHQNVWRYRVYQVESCGPGLEWDPLSCEADHYDGEAEEILFRACWRASNISQVSSF